MVKRKQKSTNNAKKDHSNNQRAWLIKGGIAIGILFIIAILIGAFSTLGYGESLRIVFGSCYVLFLPGFLITFIFFPKAKEFDDKKEGIEERGIDWIERIALSFALSIAIVPLVVFYLNLIGVKINLLNSSLTILGILIVSGSILWKKNK